MLKVDYLQNVDEENFDPFQLINIFVNDMIDKVKYLMKNIFELFLYNIFHFDYILMSKINKKRIRKKNIFFL
jgi:hypothetical protein